MSSAGRRWPSILCSNRSAILPSALLVNHSRGSVHVGFRTVSALPSGLRARGLKSIDAVAGTGRFVLASEVDDLLWCAAIGSVPP